MVKSINNLNLLGELKGVIEALRIDDIGLANQIFKQEVEPFFNNDTGLLVDKDENISSVSDIIHRLSHFFNDPAWIIIGADSKDNIINEYDAIISDIKFKSP